MADVNPFAEHDWPIEPCAGDTHTDPEGRLWTYYVVSYGARGGRWAYHAQQATHQIVVDTRQHLQSPHFAGMLSVPWDGLSKLVWVLGKPWCPRVTDKLESAPIDSTRFERLPEPPQED